MIGAISFTVDNTSTDSLGESGNVYGAFAYVVSCGACLYQDFTPTVCNKAMAAWSDAINKGLLVFNHLAIHAADEKQVYMYSLRPGDDQHTLLNSSTAAAVIADVASKVGIKDGDYIAPKLSIPSLPEPDKLPDTISQIINTVNTQPVNSGNSTNTTNTNVVTTPVVDQVESILSSWFNDKTFGISNEILLGGAAAAGVLLYMNSRGR